MVERVVLVVDADLPAASDHFVTLGRRGFTVVGGARDQVRLARVPDAAAFRLTVPVMDPVDAEVALSTVHDAVGALAAVVMVVSPGEGKPAAQVAGVSAAMALAMGLGSACLERGVPLHLVGPGAAAVAAWVAELVGMAPRLGLPGVPDEPTRRRDRVVGQARRFAQRVLGGRSS